MTTTIHTILEELRQEASSNRDLGDKFERLILGYLKNDPIYKEYFSNVWMWMDFPKRGNEQDTGIDLVAEVASTGNYCAIQCKFFDPNYTLEKNHIDSFFTASGKKLYSSRMIVSTTDNWSKHAEEALNDQQIPVKRLRVQDLADSAIDWSQFPFPNPNLVKIKPKKTLRPHQTKALEKVRSGFRVSDRGKLIMACGTGKTFTGLKIAETIAPSNGYVLFLVPSISLLSQTLREWSTEAEKPLHSIAVCSDTKVSKKSENEDITAHDLALPATTNAQQIADQVKAFGGKGKLTVIFSTYQSIQAVADAQSLGLPEFDLIICDEAHRTTGVTLQGKDESHFVKVHDQNFIKAKKRLYMTATPRIFTDGTKTQAQENDATLCSMDDENIYGSEFHRLGFSEAVGSGLLSDYKVMVLAVDEKYIKETFQSQIADANNELNLDDAVKITGCWNGLSKRITQDAEGNNFEDTSPMRRAVAFSRSIKDSQRITNLFSQIISEYGQINPDAENVLNCEVDHVDGTFNALRRNQKLDWLKAETQGNVCRILSNARCLSEGVDVPSLDAVMFLNPRNSVVDVVQSVGRVMRKAEGKKYGYIILPIGIPTDITPEEALKDNDKYKVVWQVLQALRAHDDRFNAMVNKIELNKTDPSEVKVIGVPPVGERKDEQEAIDKESGSQEGTRDKESNGKAQPLQLTLNFPNLEEWREAIYAKIVTKCGDRRYWESWAKDVATIAERHKTRIKALIDGSEVKPREAFNDFLKGLQKNINPSVSEEEAIEMLSQHLITKPVFDALFEGYEFTKRNPVSVAMQNILDVLEGQTLAKETESLERFYENVRERARGIDNPTGKQKVIIELYDKFFRTAFPRVAERLGIVYTPVEVVDFIINSVDSVLRDEFGVGLTDEDIHILDPFTGTGTFITRLLQSGLIKHEDLPRKFKKELHANEIVLLAYYIAAVNIEETYHGLVGGDYQPLNGIVLTDTFQMFEGQGTLNDLMFPENNQRVKKQKENKITVVISNPPYSVGQSSENDGNKNLKYPQLDERIKESYVKYSSGTNKNSLYDSYIRAIRWASDRIKDKGVIGFVTNGSFIDGNATDGLRKCFTDEFTSIYCFNLRGNARTSGEQRRMEKGNVFSEGTRTPVAITILIRNPQKGSKCQLFYHDIGDYLSREEKLKLITTFGGIKGIEWKLLTPNSSHDWINQRDTAYEQFISLGDKKDETAKTIFNVYSRGIVSCRDNWIYNFSHQAVTDNVTKMIDFYNSQVNQFESYLKKNNITNTKDRQKKLESFISNDTKQISWSVELKEDCVKLLIHSFYPDKVIKGMYRPFCKQAYYFDKDLNSRLYQMPKIFPNDNLENLVICVTGIGVTKDFNAFISNTLPDVQLQANGQCFPLHYYEKQENLGELFKDNPSNEYAKKENIPNSILKEFKEAYKEDMTKEDIFYYVYGILHSPEYKRRFESDLKKMLPRIPFAQDFWLFSKAGRDLAYWHLNYETIEPYPLEETPNKLILDPKEDYLVEKMICGSRNKDKTTIIYNSIVTLSGIPLEAYDYVVNGKPALEWIIERYQFTKDKDSGITNNPNDWSDDPRYILDLVKRIVRVSLETVKIVNSLPALNEFLKKD